MLYHAQQRFCLLYKAPLLQLPPEITAGFTLEGLTESRSEHLLSSCSIFLSQVPKRGLPVAPLAASGTPALGAPRQGRCFPCSGAPDQKWIDASKAPQHATPLCHPALESKLRRMFYSFPCCHLYCPQKQILLSHLISQTLCRHLFSESQTWQHATDAMGKAAPAQWCFCNNYWTQKSPTSFTLHPSLPSPSAQL